MSVYQQWTRQYLRDTIVREELMDQKNSFAPNGRWWGDTELNYYIDQWQTELQQEYDWVWGSNTQTISGQGTLFPSTQLLLSTDTLTNSVWQVFGSAVGNQPDPLGGSSAYVFTDTTGLFPGIRQTVLSTSSIFTATCWFGTQTTGSWDSLGTMLMFNNKGESYQIILPLSSSWQDSQLVSTFTSSTTSVTFEANGNSFLKIAIWEPSMGVLSQQFSPVFQQVSSITPTPDRLEAFYWDGQRLSGRLLEDLEAEHKEWRQALPDSPRMVVQYDSQSYFIWPTPYYTGTLVQEYPQALSFATDTSTVSLPFWAQFSAKSYVCSKAYSRPGPTNDLKRAMRYKKMFDLRKEQAKVVWDQYNPYRYRKLKPMGHYEVDILKPPPVTLP